MAGGAMHVAAGEQSWTAAAAPMPKPWTPREAAVIAMRWNLARGDDHLLSSQSDAHLREEDKQVASGIFSLAERGLSTLVAYLSLASWAR